MALSQAWAVREDGGEALTGVVRAGLLSREVVPQVGVPTSFPTSEGHVAGGVIASRWGTLRGRRTQARTKLLMRGNREIPRSPVVSSDAPSWTVRGVVVRRWRAARGNAVGGTPSLNERGKSDRPVVPERPPNKPGVAGAEVAEERGLREGNAASGTRPGLRAGQCVSTDLDRVRQAARRDKDVRFAALLHHVTVDRLRES